MLDFHHQFASVGSNSTHVPQVLHIQLCLVARDQMLQFMGREEADEGLVDDGVESIDECLRGLLDLRVHLEMGHLMHIADSDWSNGLYTHK